MKTEIITMVVLLSGSRFGFAQGFVNLDFNSANIPSGTEPYSFIPIADVIPGWTAYFGNNQQTSVLYDSEDVGSVNVSILDANSLVGGLIPGNNYTVLLQAGNGGGDGGLPNTAASIAQTAISHNFHAGDGPNYAYQITAINEQMHYLSTNNAVGTDYQLTLFSLTNWPTIH